MGQDKIAFVFPGQGSQYVGMGQDKMDFVLCGQGSEYVGYGPR
jgi:hypothetical protein